MENDSGSQFDVWPGDRSLLSVRVFSMYWGEVNHPGGFNLKSAAEQLRPAGIGDRWRVTSVAKKNKACHIAKDSTGTQRQT